MGLVTNSTEPKIMEIANIRLKLTKTGSDIPITNVTPAEVLVLRAAHETNANGEAVSGVEIIGTTKRTGADEVARLKAKYPNLRHKAGDKDAKSVEHLFPGVGNIVPETFKEISIVAAKVANTGPQTYDPEPEGTPVVVLTGNIPVAEEETPPVPVPLPLAPAKVLKK